MSCVFSVCVCVRACVRPSADVRASEWLRWEETQIDKMIIGLLFHGEEAGRALKCPE